MSKKIYFLFSIILFFTFTQTIYAVEVVEDLTQYKTEENKIAGEPYLNPKWIEWNSLSDEEKSKWSVVPQKIIVDYVYEEKKQSLLEPYDYDTFNLKPKAQSIPSTYNLKDEGYVSSIKNQSTLGLCWAFATVGAIESNSLKTLGKSLIFSERQIDYAISDPSTSITEGYNPYGNSERTLGDGGNFEDTYNVLLGGISPQLTSVWGSYNTSSTKQKLSKVINSDNVGYQITNTIDFPYLDMSSTSDDVKKAYNDIIKEHIMNYGGVYVSTIVPDSRSGSCYNSSYNMIYQTSTCTFSDENPYHAMLIIGWDDTYGPDYDGDGVGDGAWILKNSWGTSDHPYPYLSYNSIINAFNGIISMQEKDWDNNYNYQDLRLISETSTNSSIYTTTFKYFKDKDNKETLKRISITPYANKEYSIYINTTGKAEDDILIKQFTPDRTGICSIDIEDITINDNSFTVIIKSNYRIPTNLNVYTNDVEESTDISVTTYIENDYIGFNKTTSSSTTSFNLATFTKNIATGTKVEYKIYKDNTDVTNQFTIPIIYIINGSSLATVNYDKSVIEYGNYTIETYINSTVMNTYNFIIGGELIEDIYVPSKIVLLLGESRTLPLTIKNATAYDQSLVYSFLDDNIASIDENKLLTAKKIGTTTLNLSTNDYSNIEKNIVIEVRKLSGDGTPSNPYVITDKYDLFLINNNTTASYKILNDITFNKEDYLANGDFYNDGSSWIPLNSFGGVLDGNNKTIKGLKTYKGLFTEIRNGTLKNLVFSDCSTHNNYGGVLGIVTGGSYYSSFENISVMDSNVTSYSSGAFGSLSGLDDSSVFKKIVSSNNNISGRTGAKIGGIIGSTYNSYLDNLNNTSNISAEGGSNIGGLTGTSKNSTIINSENNGNVEITYSSSGNDSTLAGGLVGLSTDSTIISSSNAGMVSGRFKMGGIVGQADNTYIKDSYNKGELIPYKDRSSWNTHSRIFYIGGIVGYAQNAILNNVFSLVTYNSETIKTNDYYCSTAGCTVHLGGIAGYTNNVQISNYYSSFETNSDGTEVGYSDSKILNNKIDHEYILGKDFNTSANNICLLGYNCTYVWEKNADVEHIILKNITFNLNNVIYGKKGDAVNNLLYPFDNLGDNLNLSTYDSNIISITDEQVTLLNYGSTDLEISSNVGSDIKKTLTVNVIDKMINDIIIENNILELGLNESSNVNYTITPDDSSIKQLEWNIEDDNVATVDENGVVTGISEGTTTLTVTTIDGSNIEKSISIVVKDYDVKSDYFTINGKNINKIFTNLTYDKFLQYIKLNSSYSLDIFKNEEIIDYDLDKIATGMKLRTKKEDVLVNEYNIIVTGDITGDGSANATDILAQKLHILNKSLLTDEYFTAGDINSDGKVNATDIMYIKMYILGKYTTVWGK